MKFVTGKVSAVVHALQFNPLLTSVNSTIESMSESFMPVFETVKIEKNY